MSQNKNGQENIGDETVPSTQNGGNGAVLTAAQLTFSGPMPPPYLIAEYGNIDPSFPERLFGLTEREAAHRQKMEEKALDADIEDMTAERQYQRRGQAFGFSIGVIAWRYYSSFGVSNCWWFHRLCWCNWVGFCFYHW